MQTSRVGAVQQLTEWFDCLRVPTEDQPVPSEDPAVLERQWLYAIAWSVGSLLEQQDRKRFDAFLRERDEEKRMPSFISTWSKAFSTIYQYTLTSCGQWKEWSPLPWHCPDKIDISRDIFRLIVPTKDTVCATSLMAMMHGRRPMLFYGSHASAKTTNILLFVERLTASGALAKHVNFTHRTDASQVLSTVDSELSSNDAGTCFCPPKEMTFFLDDLALPNIDKWGDCPALELVRQLFEQSGFYSLDKNTRGDFKRCEKLTFVAAAGHPGGCWSDIPNRLKRQFCVLNLVLTDDTVHDIYEPILAHGFSESEWGADVLDVGKKLAKTTLRLLDVLRKELLPTPSKPHYVWTSLTALSRVFQGLFKAVRPSESAPITARFVVAVWEHECARVMRDKLVDETDCAFFDETVRRLMPDLLVDPEVDKSPELFMVSFKHNTDISAQPLYEPGGTLAEIRDRVTTFLRKYNEENPRQKMDLVLFEDAIRHLLSINRLMEIPRSSGLLVGVGGSGKRSLTLLSAYISGAAMFQIAHSEGYGISQLKKDLRSLFLSAGQQRRPTCFLFWQLESNFVEVIDSVLRTGTVPGGLFDPDELRSITAELSPHFAIDCPDVVENAYNLEKYFYATVRNNLHIFICMSPVGSRFRELGRDFAGLINLTTIDYFLPWPTEALEHVSSTFMRGEAGTEEDKQALVACMGNMHNAVIEVYRMYYERTRRAVYLTPKTYLTFLASYNSLSKKKSRPEPELENSTRRSSRQRTKAAVSGLRGEVLGGRKREFSGDCLLASAFVTYCGALDQEFRDIAIRRLKGVMVSFADPQDPVDFLVDPGTRMEWSTPNSVIISHSARYPLLIDPQEQAREWITNQEATRDAGDISMTTLSNPDFDSQLLRALTEGHALVVEGVGEELRSSLDPVLNKGVPAGANSFVALASKGQVVMAAGFMMYFVTRSPNPRLTPELQVAVVVVNFTLTEAGLKEQLVEFLATNCLSELKQGQQEAHANVRKFEALLEQLSSKEGSLHDEADERRRAIDHLRPIATRATALYFSIVAISALSPMYQTSLVRFRALVVDSLSVDGANTAPVSEHIANVVDKLTYRVYRTINRGLYERDKLSFILIVTFKILVTAGLLEGSDVTLFLRGGAALDINSVKRKPVAWLSNDAWLNVIELAEKKSFFSKLARNIRKNEGAWRRWYEDNEPEAMEIPDYEERISKHATMGGVAAPDDFSDDETDDDGESQPVDAFQLSMPELTAEMERRGLQSGGLFQDDAKALQQTFDAEHREFVEKKDKAGQKKRAQKMTNERPDKHAPAKQSGTGPFLKLLLLRALRMDRVITFARTFVASTPQLGPTFTAPVTDTMDMIYEETVNDVPVIFLLSPGSDPTANIERLCRKCKLPAPACISLGQGQEPYAIKAIDSAAAEGTWVVLMNAELGLDLMGKMGSILSRLKAEIATGIAAAFRLFILCLPHKDFPIGLLQMSIKVTNEPPAGLCGGLLRSYTELVDQDLLERIETEQWRRLLFALCFMHVCVQERRKFGPLGWCVPYGFNAGDVTACMLFLERHLRHGPISWSTFQYMVAEVQYGGKITHQVDRRIFSTYTQVWLTAQTCEDGYAFNPKEPILRIPDDFRYIIPNGSELTKNRQFIESFPQLDSPEVFGLHPNADLTFRLSEVSGLLTSLAETQPKEGGGNGGGGGESREDMAHSKATELLKRLPEDYEEADTTAKIHALGGLLVPLNSFLFQELQRLQAVIAKVRSTLTRLQCAIKGQVVMSDELQDALDKIPEAAVPRAWTFTAAGDEFSWILPTLGLWFASLLSRDEQDRAWLDGGRRNCYWMTGWFNPTGFLSAMKQEVASEHKWALDDVVYRTESTAFERADEVRAPPAEGVYVSGLFLEGAAFDKETGILVESEPKKLFTPMPVLFISGIPEDEYETLKSKMFGTTDPFDCPVRARRRGRAARARVILRLAPFVQAYKYKSRNRELLIFFVPLKCTAEKDAKHWGLRGTALLENIE